MKRAAAPAALLAASLVAALSCSSPTPSPAVEPLPCAGPSFEGAPLSVRCGTLFDAQGREVFLTGINARVAGVFDVTFDDGRAPLEEIPAFTADDVRRMRALGFGALRLPINWSGLEPREAGPFDAGYLERVAGAVDVARAAGLLVLIDVHQDAYSKEIGEDGAPLWAILPPPPKLLGGPLTDLEARRLSKPVLDAFETFFGDGPDGVRLRGRFARMVAHVAARFANDSAVIGFEIFNEPLTTEKKLTSFHAEVLAAVRAAAPRKLVLFEPSATRNFTDRAPVPSSPLGPGTVYAPHVYTASFGSEATRDAVTRDAVAGSYRAAREEADGWQAPLMVTEIGFPPEHPKFGPYLSWHAELAEELHASTFLWVWKESSQGSWGLFDRAADGGWVERAKVTSALARVRIEAVAGRMVTVRHPDGPGSLVVEIEGIAASRENLVSLGAHHVLSRATCDGAEVVATAGEPVRVNCGGPGRHVLEVRAARRTP